MPDTAARQPWSREQVEATVADYRTMLLRELRGEPYNKAEHNRNLQRLLAVRSRGAIERKHQNISAVLLYELHLPYIDGYKPLRNVQQLLREAVEEARQHGYEVEQEKDDFYREGLIEEGMTFIDVDQTPFREKAAPAVERVLADKADGVAADIEAAIAATEGN